MVGLQTLDLAIGVRVPASQPIKNQILTGGPIVGRPFCVPMPFVLKFSTPVHKGDIST